MVSRLFFRVLPQGPVEVTHADLLLLCKLSALLYVLAPELELADDLSSGESIGVLDIIPPRRIFAPGGRGEPPGPKGSVIQEWIRVRVRDVQQRRCGRNRHSIEALENTNPHFLSACRESDASCFLNRFRLIPGTSRLTARCLPSAYVEKVLVGKSSPAVGFAPDLDSLNLHLLRIGFGKLVYISSSQLRNLSRIKSQVPSSHRRFSHSRLATH